MATRYQIEEEDDKFINADVVSQASSENVNTSNSGKQLQEKMTPDKKKVASASKVLPSPMSKEQPNSAREITSSKFILTSEQKEELEKSQRSSQKAWANRWQPKETEPSHNGSELGGDKKMDKVTPRDVQPDSRV